MVNPQAIAAHPIMISAQSFIFFELSIDFIFKLPVLLRLAFWHFAILQI